MLDNPFDRDRDQAVEILRSSVPFLEHLSDDVLRHIYLSARWRTYRYDHVLFKVGEYCKALQIVVFGTVEIGLSDGDHY